MVVTRSPERLAVEVDGPSHFLGNSHVEAGATRLKRRQLQFFGWSLVNIPYFDWERAITAGVTGPCALPTRTRRPCALPTRDPTRDPTPAPPPTTQSNGRSSAFHISYSNCFRRASIATAPSRSTRLKLPPECPAQRMQRAGRKSSRHVALPNYQISHLRPRLLLHKQRERSTAAAAAFVHRGLNHRKTSAAPYVAWFWFPSVLTTKIRVAVALRIHLVRHSDE